MECWPKPGASAAVIGRLAVTYLAGRPSTRHSRLQFSWSGAATTGGGRLGEADILGPMGESENCGAIVWLRDRHK